MLINNKLLRLAVEAAERNGVARADVVRVLGADAPAVLAPRARAEWSSFVLVFDEISRLVDDDPRRLAAIGRDMRRGTTFDPLRTAARTLFSPAALYDFLDRWMTPGLPHLRFFLRRITRRRILLHGEIPEPYAACLAFFHILEGRMVGLPEMMGLPPSTLIESRISPRTADLVIDLPADQTVRGRVQLAVRSVLGRRSRLEALEEHREDLEETLTGLQRARDELRTLLDRLPDLVFVHVGGRIVWANRVLVRTLGYESQDDLLGADLVEIVAPSSRPDLATRVALPKASADASLSELRLLSRTGEEVAVELAPPQSVVFDGVVALLVVGRDVTERIRMQQKLLVADRLASVGLLAAGVAHEVNNPLAYVLNNIEIARKTGSAEASRHALGVALEGVDRIRAIVRDLLLLSRGDDRSVGLIDVRCVVESTLSLAAREVERTARLVLDVQPVPLVRANGPCLAQVLLNLVTNALDAMHGRSFEESRLTVRVAESECGRVLLEVSDTGRGIPCSDLGRVFEPFFTTKPAERGTGLGLSIAQRLVTELGGEIAVSSEVERGTTFRVLLPAQSPGAG